MESEHKVFSIMSVSIAAIFIVLMVIAKGCNDSDNALHKYQADKGCAYYGNGVFDCRNALK